MDSLNVSPLVGWGVTCYIYVMPITLKCNKCFWRNKWLLKNGHMNKL